MNKQGLPIKLVLKKITYKLVLNYREENDFKKFKSKV